MITAFPKSIILASVFFLASYSATAQQVIVACSDFNDNTTQGWTGTGASLGIGSSAAASPYLGCQDNTVEFNDSRVNAPAIFHGDWRNCMTFCFDVMVIVAPCKPKIIIKGSNYTAFYEVNFTLPPMKWYHICAPVHTITDGDPLPAGWQLSSGAPAGAWNSLLADVSSVSISIESGLASGWPEHVGFDNICLTRACACSGVFAPAPPSSMQDTSCSCTYAFRLTAPQKVDKIVLHSAGGTMTLGCGEDVTLPGNWTVEGGGSGNPGTLTFRAPDGSSLPCCEEGILRFGISSGGAVSWEAFYGEQPVCNGQSNLECNPCACSVKLTKLSQPAGCSCGYRLEIISPDPLNSIRLSTGVSGAVISGISLSGQLAGWTAQAQGNDMLISGASTQPCTKLSLDFCLSGGAMLKVSANEGRSCKDSALLICDSCDCSLQATKQENPKCDCMYELRSKNPAPVTSITIRNNSGAIITDGASQQLSSKGWVRTGTGTSQLTFSTLLKDKAIPRCDEIAMWICVDRSAAFIVESFNGRTLVCRDSVDLECDGPRPCGPTTFMESPDCDYTVDHLNTNQYNVPIDDFHIRVLGSPVQVRLVVLETPVGWIQTSSEASSIDIKAAGHSNAIPPGQHLSGLRFRIEPSCVGVRVAWFSTSHLEGPPDTMICYGADSLECGGECVTMPRHDQLVGWWTMDEVSGSAAIDIGPHGNHGIRTIYATTVNGVVDRAVHFPPSGGCQSVQVPHDASLDFVGTPGFTLDAWVRVEPGNERSLIDKMQWFDFNRIQGYSLEITATGLLQLSLAKSGFSGVYTQPSASQTKVDDGKWHHVAVTVDRTDWYLIMYIDGVIVHEEGIDAAFDNTDNTQPLRFGCSDYGKLFGDLDEVEIFSDVLSQQDVYDIWTAGTCGKCKRTVTSDICGVKYEDVNHSGSRDPDEPGLEAWPIALYDENGNSLGSVLTDAGGEFCFDGLPAGTYVIREGYQQGWTQTQPDNPEHYTVILTAGQDATGLQFGNIHRTDCSKILPGTTKNDALACKYSFTIDMPLDPMTDLTLAVDGGLLSDLTLIGCPTALPPDPPLPGASTSIHFMDPWPGPITGTITLVPQTPDGVVTVYWTMLHMEQTVCYDTTEYRCCIAPCDSVASWPVPDDETSNDSRAFLIINNTPSPIAWIEWTLDPDLSTATGSGCSGTLDGGKVYVDGVLRPGVFMFPFMRAPANGVFNPPAQSTVQFNLGIDWYCNYSGVVNFVVHHADSSICYLTSDAWTVVKPEARSFVEEVPDPGRRLLVMKLKVRNVRELDIRYVSVGINDLADEYVDFNSITAAPVPNGEQTRDLALLADAMHNKKYAMFEFVNPLRPGTVSGAVYMLLSVDSAFRDNPVLRVTAYDKTGGILMYDSCSTVTEIKTLDGGTLPDSFELLDCFPNPSQGFSTVNFALGKSMQIRLELYDNSGKRVQTLFEGRRESGLHGVRFDSGALPSGTYYIRMEADGGSATLPAAVVK